MGGSHEIHLPGPDSLRIHESGGNVHVHDDKRGTKFCMMDGSFKGHYKKAKKKLEAQQPPYQESIKDANGVRLVGELVGELDNDAIEWRLEVGQSVPVGAGTPAGITGFDELDDFVGNL